METIKYKVIKSRAQYNQYCKNLESLLEKGKRKIIQDEIDLLTVLIEKWDSEHNSFEEIDPVQLLTALMEEHKMKPRDLVTLLNISKGYVSEILHYKKGLSKEVIRKLAEHFRVSQEALNRPYKLKHSENGRLRKADTLNSKKRLATA